MVSTGMRVQDVYKGTPYMHKFPPLPLPTAQTLLKQNKVCRLNFTQNIPADDDAAFN